MPTRETSPVVVIAHPRKSRYFRKMARPVEGTDASMSPESVAQPQKRKRAAGE